MGNILDTRVHPNIELLTDSGLSWYQQDDTPSEYLWPLTGWKNNTSALYPELPNAVPHMEGGLGNTQQVAAVQMPCCA
jgi:hypothetical protein